MDGSSHTQMFAAHGPMLRAAKLFSVEGRMIVTMLDMAGDMAVATTEAPPPQGSIAVLTRSGLRLPATVDWVDGRRFGLRLDEPLSPPLVERFAGVTSPATERAPLASAFAA